MKSFMLLLVCLSLLYAGSKYYVVRDHSGTIITETKDLSVLKMLSNVKVDTVEAWDGMKMSIIDAKKVDTVKDSMLSRYAPKSAVYHYIIEWNFGNGGIMKLVKSANNDQGLLSYDWKAENWLKAAGFVDILVPAKMRPDSLILEASITPDFQKSVFSKVAQVRPGEKIFISIYDIDTVLVSAVVDSLIGLGYGVRCGKNDICVQKRRFQNAQ